MKKNEKVFISIVLIIAIIIYAIHWAFFDIQRIKGQEVLQEVNSPGGKYTTVVYLNNGGATTDYAILGSVKDNETGKERNIYWMYPCWEVDVQWENETTVVINGVELDILKDSYDYRND